MDVRVCDESELENSGKAWMWGRKRDNSPITLGELSGFWLPRSATSETLPLPMLHAIVFEGCSLSTAIFLILFSAQKT